MITIASFDNTEQAELLRGQLEQDGIDAFVADAAVVTLNWMYSNAVGGVKVQVNEDDLERAKALLKDLGTAAGVPAPLSPYRCPHCASTRVEFRRVSRSFFMLSLLLLGIPLAFYRPRLNCMDCGKTWKREPAAATGATDTDQP